MGGVSFLLKKKGRRNEEKKDERRGMRDCWQRKEEESMAEKNTQIYQKRGIGWEARGTRRR